MALFPRAKPTASVTSNKVDLTLAEYVRLFFIMPTLDKYGPFSFKGRPYWEEPYESDSKSLLFLAGRQTNKCVRETERVLTPDRGPVPISEIRVGDSVVTLLADGARLGNSRVVWKSERLEKPCVRVGTRLGHSADMATTHPVRSWGSWTETGSLSVGDRIASVRRTYAEENGSSVSSEWVTLLAYLLADGGFSRVPEVNFTKKDGLVQDEFKSIAWKLDLDVYESDRRPNGVSCYRIRGGRGGPVQKFLSSCGLLGLKSKDKFIPEWVYRLPEDQRRLFLNRLWACDGHVSARESCYAIVYSSTSLKLSRGVQALLWSVGIPSSIASFVPLAYEGTDKRGYRVSVETQEGVRTFLSEVGALGKSEGTPLPTSEDNSNRDTYPIGIQEDLRRIVGSGVIARSDSLGARGLRKTLKYPPSRRKLREYVSYFRSVSVDQALVNSLEGHCQTDLIWDEVTSLIPIGDQSCYDLEVEGTHSFVVEGLITHNSTALGNRLLALSMLRLNFMSLYVSPTETQTKQFSNDRIAVPIRLSKYLRNYTASALKNDVFHRSFTTGSEIRLRYAYHNADRIRGIQANLLCMDEVQDIVADNIPVIEQTLFTSPEKYKIYAGTPKSENNTLSYLWYESTMNEWLVPCHRHSFVVWNRCTEENIPKDPSLGMVCRKCHKSIYAVDPMSHWASMNPSANKLVTTEGYRFPQLIAPDVDWADMVYSHQTYPRAQFYNERLGLPHENASRPITMEQLKSMCDPDASIYNDTSAPRNATWACATANGSQHPVWMGVDWGSGENSYTYITIGSYLGGTRMRIIYFERLVGDLTEFDRQIAHILHLASKFHVTRVGCDYGGGFDKNIKLVQALGHTKVWKYQYANAKNKLYYDSKLGRFIVHRTEIMTAMFDLIKRGRFHLPRWEECETRTGIATETLAIHTEEDKKGTMMYSHAPKTPDDGFHSWMYMTLVSIFDRPMQDLIVPGMTQHDPNVDEAADVYSNSRDM